MGSVPDADGFVCHPQVFVGNLREHRTLAEMLEVLDAPRVALMVTDRGITTGERPCRLRGQGYLYLAVSRECTRHFDAEHFVYPIVPDCCINCRRLGSVKWRRSAL